MYTIGYICRLAPVVLAVALGACAGTDTTLHKVQGGAPESGNCRVRVTDAESRRVLYDEVVRGRFSVGYPIGDSYPLKVNIAGICDGKIVKEFNSYRPGGMGVVDLGGLGP